MMMAVGFIGAFVSYALGAIATHSQATAALATAR
jgi:uncharacterized Ntn-hydrolase superfamily protein